MTFNDLMQLESLLIIATPRPWSQAYLERLLRFGSKTEGSWNDELQDGEYVPDNKDAAFIIKAIEMLPDLIECAKLFNDVHDQIVTSEKILRTPPNGDWGC